ncbi:hypothetical protein ACPV51_25465, partial [Vibrio astriarenae]
LITQSPNFKNNPNRNWDHSNTVIIGCHRQTGLIEDIRQDLMVYAPVTQLSHHSTEIEHSASNRVEVQTSNEAKGKMSVIFTLLIYIVNLTITSN